MDGLAESLRDAWGTLDEQAQEIVIIGLLLAGVWLIRRVLARIFITRLHRLTRQSGTQWNELVINVIQRPLRYLTIAILLSATTVIFDFRERIDLLIIHISSTIVVVAVFMLVYALVSYATQNTRLMERITGIQVDEKLLPFVSTGVRIILIAVAAVIIIREWGYDINGLVAGLGLGGLAFALAAQDTLSNLFGFTMIVSDQPFVEGDYIKTPDVEGVVEKVGLRSTRIRQTDQAVVSVPNSKLTNAPILNWSRLRKRRIDFTLQLEYNATSGQLKLFLAEVRQMLGTRPHVEPNSIVVYFVNFGKEGLEVLIRCYVLLADWGQFTAEKEVINLTLMDIMERLGLRVASSLPIFSIDDLPAPVASVVLPSEHSPEPPMRRIRQADEPNSLEGPKN